MCVCGLYLFYQLSLALQEHGPHGFLQQHDRTGVHHPPPNRMGDEKTGAQNSIEDSFRAGEIQNDHIRLQQGWRGKKEIGYSRIKWVHLMMWHGRVRTELRTPSVAPLILGSGLRRETPALDSFLLQYLRVWSLIHILMFSALMHYSLYNKKKKKDALNARNERLDCDYGRQELPEK